MNQPIRVALADDHPLFRRGLREVIESDPTLLVVGEAGDGVSMLRLIKEQAAAVAILDIDMPTMGGLTLAREIQAGSLDVQVIFLTMYKEEDMFTEAMDLGARAYVLKESAVEDILAAIHAVSAGKYFISPALSDLLVRRSARVEGLLRSTPALETLSPAELRILRLVAENRTTKEIADLLSISAKTVENHRTNIASKLRLRGSHSLLKFALENRSILAKR